MANTRKTKVSPRATGKPATGARPGRPRSAASGNSQDLADFHNQIVALSKAQAVLEMSMEGKIIAANENFLRMTGYTESELVGQDRSILVSLADRTAPEYITQYEKLGRGEFILGQFKRVTRSGKEIWVDGSYCPVMGADGKPYKIVVYCTEVTAQVEHSNDFEDQMMAIYRVRNSIEYAPDGTVLMANDLFLRAYGYTLDEIKGKHHSMFVDPEHRNSSEYRTFWDKLGRGEPQVGQYKRLTRDGSVIWSQSNYNPSVNKDGKVYKIVNFGTDVSQLRAKTGDLEGQLAAIYKSQAVIQFSMDGKILEANENFLQTVGYSMNEIKGQHHSMFVDPASRQTNEYRMFWEKLGRGEYDAGQYKRIGKGGKEVWIQASYNPIHDLDGKPFKVVKYATDITEQVKSADMLKAAVDETQEVVTAAKEGDLTQRISLDGKTGTVETLCSGINSLVETMVTVISQTKDAIGSISTAAKEIATGNADLSQRTEKQAASLEETASSMEELTSTVKQNAENAKQANQLAVGAADVAVKGGGVVGQVVSTMSSINDSSKKIVDIISVIDGIAFQTNILALNAAVEAARAGEQGRGFAVVATEVRNLAQRSAAAAKEIKTLINDSVEKVSNGTRLVDEAGTTMAEVVTAIKRVNDIMSEITAASQEQSQGIEQVNQAITQMDEVTQQNAALVEQAAAAAESLEEQAVNLTDVMGGFNVGAGSGSSAKSVDRRDAATRPTNVKRLPAAKPATPAPAKKAAPAASSGSGRVASGGDTSGDSDEWNEF